MNEQDSIVDAVSAYQECIQLLAFVRVLKVASQYFKVPGHSIQDANSINVLYKQNRHSKSLPDIMPNFNVYQMFSSFVTL